MNEGHYDDPEIHASPIDENNMLLWKAAIVGPQDTPFENGIFNMLIEFSNDYPCAPPSKIVFISRMFHPNVSSTGPRMVITTRNSEIKIRHGEIVILGNIWNPSYDVYTILKAIQTLLGFPDVYEITNIINPDAAKLFKENYEEYKKCVLQCVEESLREDKTSDIERYCLDRAQAEDGTWRAMDERYS